MDTVRTGADPSLEDAQALLNLKRDTFPAACCANGMAEQQAVG
jgi:hypothetical protein